MPLSLHRHQGTQQVVTWALPPVFSQRCEVITQRQQALLGFERRLQLSAASALEGSCLVSPALELVTVIRWHSQHFGNDDRWQRVGQISNYVHAPRRRNTIQQEIDDGFHPLSQVLHDPWRKRL